MQKPLALYQFETVPEPIKDDNTEANLYARLQTMNNYLAMTEENYVSLILAELDTCKHIGHIYFCKTIFLVKHKTSKSCESAVFFDLSQDIIDNN